MLVRVGSDGVERALKVLKRKLTREGVFREMKRRAHYVKPSEVRKRDRAAAVKRAQRSERSRSAER